MLNDKDLENAMQDLIVDICELMYTRGYRAVPIGALMRLIGVNDETAAQHDHELFQLDDEFEQLINQKKPARKGRRVTVPPNVTLH